MELNVRKGADRFVPAGAFRGLQERLRRRAPELAEIPALVFSAFDRRTRLLPFVVYDRIMFPPAAIALAGALHGAGFSRTRAVYQLWNPSLRPSRARLDGLPIEMLLVSSMEIHSQRAYAAIGDAHALGSERPLIIAGGPKAIYEPAAFWSNGGAPPDVVVTGETYVLLELLEVLLAHRGRGERLRDAFERARRDAVLDAIPGLVYLAPGATNREPLLIDTGLQRLVQDLDELPNEATGLGLIEAPHRRGTLAPQPLAVERVHRHAMIASVLATQGCRFTCGYCPIPALQQKSWRHRSPEGIVDAIRTVHERFGIKYFFGADDNFFNVRDTAEQLLDALAHATTDGGRPFGERLRFATEATEVDTYKHRDLLPLGKRGGLYALWFGIEDLTASLVNKGQKPHVTTELFRILDELKISPMPMLMYHAGQPFHSPGSLYGLANQVEFLRRAGAVSMQITVHTPMVGTREYESAYRQGRVIARIGDRAVADVLRDANHVTVSDDRPSWRRQLEMLAGYAIFYNPWNLLRTLRNDRSPLRRRRIGYQAVGTLATAWTVLKMVPYTLRLLTRRLDYHAAPPRDVLPLHLTVSGVARYPSERSAGTPVHQ